MTKILILLTMIFMHIVDDYYLQGWLASAKQKEWWVKNAPNELYKHDYIWALFMHSFSWTFMVMLPIVVVNGFSIDGWFIGLFIFNVLFHAFTDNAKANWKVINLIGDQLGHMLQISLTWLWLVVG